MRASWLVALAAVLFAVATADASAVTIMVNGDTPSKRWQRVADTAAVPMPKGIVYLYLANRERCGDASPGTYAGCAEEQGDGIAPRIWVDPHPRTFHGAQRQLKTRQIFLHELGHIYDFTQVTDVTRSNFLKLWGRPGDDWRHVPDPQDVGSLISWEEVQYKSSSAFEWFAQIYAWCADRTMRHRGYGIFGYYQIPLPDSYDDELAIERRARDSCRLIRANA